MRAEDGAQTRDPQLGRLMLYQLSYFRISNLWARMDSNHRRHKPADLQSAPFGHSGTCPFEKLCFNNESGRRGSNPRPSAWKANALSTELLPHLYFLWAKMDSNHRRRKPADLQSAPFGHSGICPLAIESLTTDVAFFNCDAKIQLFF